MEIPWQVNLMLLLTTFLLSSVIGFLLFWTIISFWEGYIVGIVVKPLIMGGLFRYSAVLAVFINGTDSFLSAQWVAWILINLSFCCLTVFSFHDHGRYTFDLLYDIFCKIFKPHELVVTGVGSLPQVGAKNDAG